jgi:hypothetical protein
MGQIHELVAQHGRDTARKLVPFEEKRLVDLAADVLADEKVAAGFTYSGFCMASLPHRSLPDNSEWVRKSDDFSLIIEPGKLFRHGEEEGTLYGVPFGPRARVILLYLQSEAIKTNSREIELGSSMRQWLDRMGIERGGKTYRAFRDQAARISACRLTFAFKKHGREGFIRDSIVDGGLSLFDIAVDGRQGRLWRETVLLGEKFFQSLKKHPVPLWDGAVSRLANQSLGIDIYCWLAYRLHTLSQSSTIAWPALYAQFGASYAHLHHFKPRFLESLKTVLIVYPDAKVVVSDDRGLTLFPSAPPVRERRLIG